MADRTWSEMHKESTTTLEGDFPVIIVKADAAKSSNDKDMIKFQAKIESGPYAGRPLWGQFTISPESPVAMRIFFTHMAVLGIDAKFWEANPNAPMQQVADALLNRRAIATLGVRQWQGQDREEIQQWKPPLGGNAPAVGALGGLGSAAAATPLGGLATPSTPTTPASTATSPVAVAEPSTAPPDLPF